MSKSKLKVESGKWKVEEILSKNFQLSTFNFQLKKGFSLIDVLLTMFLVVMFTSILLVGSGSYLTSRKSSLRTLAAKIASEQIGSIRKQVKNSPTYLTTLVNPYNASFNHPDIAKLPGGSGTKSLTNFGASDIKLTTVIVSWTEEGESKSVKLETIIYQNGLN